ncbi:ferritin-like domain-containing protein [Nibribacter koreensis]|uniref:Ferritin-like domain-containing protein n=1 Tax=Nibribacter koreensis TaxID=1084519 RepID=A0ABP8FHZ8_9BACT
MAENLEPTPVDETSNRINTPFNRRNFLKYTGLTMAATAIVLTGCDDDDDDTTPMAEGSVNLGTGDVGILNYAYALEQLEAAFYTQVVANAAFSTAFPSALERSILTDIRNHEVAHREFFKAAIPAASRIPDLTPDFSAVNFSSRASVLATAKTFEDLGVAAYNGAGKLFTDTGNGLTYLTLAGKIVSVEARHAAEIRDLISNGDFAKGDSGIIAGRQIVDTNGLDVALMPLEVLQRAQPFIKQTIVATGLPTQ